MIRAVLLMLLLPAIFPPKAERKNIDKNRSVIFWKGTKLGGAGKHEGTLRFAGGYLVFDRSRITGGHLTVNMHSIRISDIPPDDVIPMRNLSRHLHHELETDKYPAAIFTIRHASFTGKNRLEINGLMRIKNRIAPTAMAADIQRLNGEIKKPETTLRINRFAWKHWHKRWLAGTAGSR